MELLRKRKINRHWEASMWYLTGALQRTFHFIFMRWVILISMNVYTKIQKLWELSSNLSMTVLVAHSCPALGNPMDGGLPGSSIHGIFQVGILEWIAIPFSRGSSWPRDCTHISCIAGGFVTTEPPGKPPFLREHLANLCGMSKWSSRDEHGLDFDFILKYLLIFIYLTAPGLTCGTWNLCSACGIFFF